MRVLKCWFCSGPIYPGHGISFVRNDCKVFNFCRSKCHKNFKLKRNPRRVRWTKTFRHLTGKEMTNDATLEFEKIHDAPKRYNRVLMSRTIKAVHRIDEIKTRRRQKHYNRRILASKEREKQVNLSEIKKGIHLLVGTKEPAQTKILNKIKLKEDVEMKDSL